jgi:hypothetical protein
MCSDWRFSCASGYRTLCCVSGYRTLLALSSDSSHFPPLLVAVVHLSRAEPSPRSRPPRPVVKKKAWQIAWQILYIRFNLNRVFWVNYGLYLMSSFCVSWSRWETFGLSLSRWVPLSLCWFCELIDCQSTSNKPSKLGQAYSKLVQFFSLVLTTRTRVRPVLKWCRICLNCRDWCKI